MAQPTSQIAGFDLCQSRNLLKKLAGTTGLEPAASAVTGQRSNQLNYVPTRQINEVQNRQGPWVRSACAHLTRSAPSDPDRRQPGPSRNRTSMSPVALRTFPGTAASAIAKNENDLAQLS